MFIVLAMIIGLIIGLIRKGSISNILSSKPKLWYLGLIGVLIQIFLHLSYYIGTLQLGMVGTVLQFLSYILILVMFIFNFNNMWAVIMAVGVTICFIVVFLNGGLMPVSDAVYNALNNNALAQTLTKESNNVYTLMSSGAMTLWFLGIYIPVPFLAQITSIYGAVPGIAIGEVLIFIGMIGWVQYAMNKNKVKQPVKERLEFDPDSDELPIDHKHRKSALFEGDDDEDGIFGDKEFTGAFLSNKGDRDLLEEALREEAERERAEKEKELEKTLDEDDEDAITRVIPELSAMETFSDAYQIEDPLADDDGKYDTKVFTGFKELVFEDKSAASESEVVEEPQKAEQQDPGYFTQLFYAEKQAEEEAKQAQENPVWDPTSAFFVKSDVGEPVSFDEAAAEQDAEAEEVSAVKSYNWVTMPKYKQTSNFDRSSGFTAEREEAPVASKSKVSEEEMLNVWKQVSVDMQNNKRQRTKYYADDANPFRDANEARERELELRRQREAAQKVEDKKKAILAEKWNAYKETYFKDEGVTVYDDRPADSTKPVASVQEVLSPAPAPEPKKSAEDLKKESMGFEKVMIEVEGRQISFWQRKK